MNLQLIEDSVRVLLNRKLPNLPRITQIALTRIDDDSMRIIRCLPYHDFNNIYPAFEKVDEWFKGIITQLDFYTLLVNDKEIWKIRRTIHTQVMVIYFWVFDAYTQEFILDSTLDLFDYIEEMKKVNSLYLTLDKVIPSKSGSAWFIYTISDEIKFALMIDSNRTLRRSLYLNSREEYDRFLISKCALPSEEANKQVQKALQKFIDNDHLYNKYQVKHVDMIGKVIIGVLQVSKYHNCVVFIENGKINCSMAFRRCPESFIHRGDGRLFMTEAKCNDIHQFI